MSKEDEVLVRCKNCSYDIKKGIRRCPYCGILNPTLEVKEVLVTIIAVLVIVFIISIL